MKQKIYNYSPYFVKFILVNIKAYINKKKRYNEFYKPIYDELLENSVSKREVVLKYQKKQLIKLLTECYQYSEFYKKRFLSNNVSIEEIKNKPYDVLFKLPLLTKDERKKYVDKIINLNPKRKVSSIGYTSGTTGTPTKNYTDKETEAISFALWNRFHNTIGINKKSKHIRFSSNLVANPNRLTPPFWVYNIIDNQLMMSVFNLKEENLKFYINKMNEFQPVYIDGFPSAIFIIADYIVRNKLKLSFKLSAICTTAETLFENQRIVIEEAFGCKVYNQYASSEGSPFITECKAGNMHLEEDSGVFEILDDNNVPVKDDNIGRLVVTSLRNWKTPLLRYDILDYVELSNNHEICSCGSPFKYIKSVHGRSNDVLWTFDRGYVSGGIATSIKNVQGIKQLQIIQKTPTDFEIIIVKNDNYKISDETYITKNLKLRLGENININFVYKDKINHNISGKLKLLIREFNVNDYINKK